tara:strand:- start:3366 stop:4421 length:1056 start_codon:yes stop_codon:yes gene_type:complete
MKFIDKKERVMDLKLTSYGHYLLSIGKFKPQFYAFYDDNVLYDGAYAQITESSNTIHNRIKNKTQYMESQVLFEEVDTAPEIIDEGSMSYYVGDVTPIMYKPRKDNFRFEQAIGDAFLDGDTNIAPAWKMVALQGKITSSAMTDTTNDFKIPQINIQLNYRRKIIDPKYLRSFSTNIREEVQRVENEAIKTKTFADGNVIQLIPDDLMMYTEEINTSLLVENFDIEVYEVLTGSLDRRCPTCEKQDKFRRLFFENDTERINGGLMAPSDTLLSENTLEFREDSDNFLSSSIGYYLNILTDQSVDHQKACKAANVFNKQTLYIDLDFECGEDKKRISLLDIYGPVTEPEICQ